MQNPVDYSSVIVPSHIGGLSMSLTENDTYTVVDAKALRMVYSLDCSNDEAKMLAAAWEEGALQVIVTT